jgi:hypothetical protein
VKKAYDLKNTATIGGAVSQKAIRRRKEQINKTKARVEDLLEQDSYLFKVSVISFASVSVRSMLNVM